MTPKVDAATTPEALDTTLNIDTNHDVVEITQRSDRFALHPQRVVIPFQAVVVMAAQIILHKNNVQQAGPNGNESRSVM